MFQRAGFNLIALPGRDWAFLAEFGPPRPVDLETLVDWLWRPNPENIAMVGNDRFGPLFLTIGLESARCYLKPRSPRRGRARFSGCKATCNGRDGEGSDSSRALDAHSAAKRSLGDEIDRRGTARRAASAKRVAAEAGRRETSSPLRDVLDLILRL